MINMSTSFQTILQQLEENARQEKSRSLAEKQRKRKSATVAQALALSLGMFGAHHFYLRRPFFGVAYFLTLGLCGVGYIVDLFRVGSLVDEINNSVEEKEDQFDVDEKTNIDAYVLWFPCGLLGFHHFYLGNYGLGIVYFCTLGVYGIGWFIDFFRIPSLVSVYNAPLEEVPKVKTTTTAYLFALSPFGILGLHHYYLNRWKWGLLYTLTGGIFGIGWLVDLFRIPQLVTRANNHLGGEGLGLIHIDDVYLLWFPFGILGAHHYYLGRHGWALLYFCTLGLFTVGWLFDSCRIPCLVITQNKHAGDENDITYAKEDFVSTIYDHPTEFDKCGTERIIVKERKMDLDLSHFVIMNSGALRVSPRPQRHANSFFQPLESPIHRRLNFSANLAGKLGPKRGFSTRSTKTVVRKFPQGMDNGDDSSENDDIIITKVIRNPQCNDAVVTKTAQIDDVVTQEKLPISKNCYINKGTIISTSQNDDVVTKRPFTNDVYTKTARNDDVVIKTLAQSTNKALTTQNDDVAMQRRPILSIPGTNDVTTTILSTSNINDGEWSPRSDDDVVHVSGPVLDGRGENIKATYIYGGLSTRDISQWMGWMDDDIIL